jgi:outer membrane murein-binding lipoprotein Lpp
MARIVGLVLGSIAAGAWARDAAGATPISKVLQLMNELKEKSISEKNAEETKYSAFAQWCENQKRIKTKEIKVGNMKIEELNAAIEQATVDIKKLTDRILELEEDNGRWKQDQTAAQTVRSQEAVDFKATVLDYTESYDAITAAIAVLKKQSGATAQAAALIQVSRSKMVPDEAKSALSAFLQGTQGASAAGPDEMLFRSAPEAAGYESQSGGVIDMLEKLQDEFTTKKTNLEKEELTAQHTFEQIMQQLTDNIEKASQEIARKTRRRAETQQFKADSEAELAQTIADRDEDQKYLNETTVLCEQKASDFASRTSMREGEIEALSQAIEIIGGGAVKGAGEKHLPPDVSLLQKSSALVQLSNAQLQSPLQPRVAALLADAAHRTGSRLLSEVSAQVAANPFVKVKKMIKDLIVKLMEEATAESEHKGWCDAELAENKKTREERTMEINELTAKIEDLNAEIAQLTQDLANLAKAIQELDAARAEATEDRTSSKATNEQTIKESKEAQTAVDQATSVLSKYYAKAAEATALIQDQGPAEDAPETFSKEFKGNQDAGGGIIDMLEVILSDFARLESETSAAETTQADEYEKFMNESELDKAMKVNESGHKTNRKTDREGSLHTAEEERKAEQDQLDKANAYFDKLKPTCIDSGITYEDRVKGREAEIQSLTEALKILQGQDLPTLR